MATKQSSTPPLYRLFALILLLLGACQQKPLPTPTPSPTTTTSEWALLLFVSAEHAPTLAQLTIPPNLNLIVAQEDGEMIRYAATTAGTLSDVETVPRGANPISDFWQWGRTRYSTSHFGLWLWHEQALAPDVLTLLGESADTPKPSFIALALPNATQLDWFIALQPLTPHLLTSQERQWEIQSALLAWGTGETDLPTALATAHPAIRRYDLTSLPLDELGAWLQTATQHAKNEVNALALARQLSETGDDEIDIGLFITHVSQLTPLTALMPPTTLTALEGITIPFSPAITSPYPPWQRFLTTFYSLTLPAPTIKIEEASAAGEVTHLANPAYLRYTISGRQLANITLYIEQNISDSTSQIVWRENTTPPLMRLPNGESWPVWEDGVHAGSVTWDTQATYLSDSRDGMFVGAWPSDDPTLWGVRGALLSADLSPIAATLWFNKITGELNHVTSAQGKIITPSAGNTWQLGQDEGESAEPRPNTPTLSLEGLTLTLRPVPTGEYAFVITLENRLGQRWQERHSFKVEARTESAERSYLDPHLGFYFNYPASWSPIRYGPDDTYLMTTGKEGEQWQLQLVPSITQTVSADSLQADLLSQWESITLLYQDATTIAEEFALRTFYGYQTEEGASRTGVLLTFRHGLLGYILDLDYPSEQETTLHEVAERLVTSWQFRPIGGQLPPSLASLTINAVGLPIPNGFIAEQLPSGWKRLRQENSETIFVAFRTDPLSGQESAEVSQNWIDLAVKGLPDIQRSSAQGYALAGYAWTRYDFSYTRDGQPIQGMLMSSVTDQERIIWAETTAEAWSTFEETVLALGSAEFGR